MLETKNTVTEMKNASDRLISSRDMGYVWSERVPHKFMFLLQGDLSTQGSNSSLLHWPMNSSPLHHLEAPYNYYYSTTSFALCRNANNHLIIHYEMSIPFSCIFTLANPSLTSSLFIQHVQSISYVCIRHHVKCCLLNNVGLWGH